MMKGSEMETSMEDNQKALQELHDTYLSERDKLVNPDTYNGQAERDVEAYRWHQIGAHEHVARRRHQLAGGARRGIDALYRGPDATVEERNRAYDDLIRSEPHLPDYGPRPDDTNRTVERLLRE